MKYQGKQKTELVKQCAKLRQETVPASKNYTGNKEHSLVYKGRRMKPHNYCQSSDTNENADLMSR